MSHQEPTTVNLDDVTRLSFVRTKQYFIFSTRKLGKDFQATTVCLNGQKSFVPRLARKQCSLLTRLELTVLEKKHVPVCSCEVSETHFAKSENRLVFV